MYLARDSLLFTDSPVSIRAVAEHPPPGPYLVVPLTTLGDPDPEYNYYY